ncbi:LacI family DNA-binding transcriptional regulator [Nonomuraea lactucae]|uniref:LacI family DNA-binding transcriptional regulator n=1 Tax=Nonomuraea lactucae TaxID=2249762 RepID=UPI001963F66E|nr:LacI family DNA-binding transcriptional regulator [Nonomuraea lactucae]
MADVARIAGVSVTTVSHVINGTRKVNPETEQAVRSALEATGYTNDVIARSLRTGTTRTIGLAMSAISNPYFADVVHAVEQRATEAGYTLLLVDTHDTAQQELIAVQQLTGRRVDAVIIAPSAHPEPALAYLRARKTATVLIDRFFDAELDQVGADNAAPTALLVEHLHQIGHQRIGLIAGLTGLATSEERMTGYREGLRRCGLRYNDALVAEGGSAKEPAQEAVKALMTSRRPPTGLVVANNQMTIGAMRGLRELGVKVPDDLALVAFDDFEWADLFHPRLTTIAQPTQAIGEMAVNMLLSRLRSPGEPARKVRLGATLVHRDSCGCPPDAPG